MNITKLNTLVTYVTTGKAKNYLFQLADCTATFLIIRKSLSFLILILLTGFISVPAICQEKPSFQQLSQETRDIATKYFAAYIARDWDSLELLLADDGGFSDPTAEPVFGPVEYSGKQATLKNFRDNYAAITHMDFKENRVLISGEFAIFEGTLNWGLSLSGGKVVETNNTPFLTILRVKNGLVVEHRDYADYAPFLTAYRKAKAAD